MALAKSEEQLLKEIHQRLAVKAIEPCKPESRFYENVYGRTDGEDLVAKMKKQIEWASAESTQLFSGFRGAGKTTELFRLRHDLESQGFLVLYADALDYLSPSEEVDIVTMLLVVAGSFGERLEKAIGANIPKESFWRRATSYLNQTTVEIDSISVKGEASTPAKALLGDFKAGVDLKLALKTAPSFRQKLQALLADRLYELRAQVVQFIEESVKLARHEKPDLQIVFLFDQFEQIRGSRSNEEAVIHSVEQLFANHLKHLHLPYVHVIYTVPPWLQFVLPAAFSIETLPCVRLSNKDPERTRYETGWALLREAVIKRFEPASFAMVFGGGEAGQLLADRLIGMSGIFGTCCDCSGKRLCSFQPGVPLCP